MQENLLVRPQPTPNITKGTKGATVQHIEDINKAYCYVADRFNGLINATRKSQNEKVIEYPDPCKIRELLNNKKEVSK